MCAIENEVCAALVGAVAARAVLRLLRVGEGAQRTQARIAELQRLQSRSYEDKLRGTITETQWREHHERWQAEIDGRPQDASSSRDEFLARIRMPFELVQTARDQNVTQDSTERARLLDALGSNCTVTDGGVSVSVGSPFDVLLRAAERSYWPGFRTSNRSLGSGQPADEEHLSLLVISQFSIRPPTTALSPRRPSVTTRNNPRQPKVQVPSCGVGRRGRSW